MEGQAPLSRLLSDLYEVLDRHHPDVQNRIAANLSLDKFPTTMEGWQNRIAAHRSLVAANRSLEKSPTTMEGWQELEGQGLRVTPLEAIQAMSHPDVYMFIANQWLEKSPTTIEGWQELEGQGPRAMLLEALQALIHPDPQIRNAANQWLESFQTTMEAWQVSDNLLHDPNSSLEELYFCAQTIRTKVQRDFEQLPPSAPLSLRSSLWTLLMKFKLGPAAVKTQLSLAMAALAVQTSGEDWGQGGVVQWLGQELGSQPEAIPVVLELLAVFPQEANSYKIAVRPERRRQFHRDLVASEQKAFDLLRTCLSGGSVQVREQVLRAFAAWMRLSYGVPASTLATHPLVAASLAGLDSE